MSDGIVPRHIWVKKLSGLFGEPAMCGTETAKVAPLQEMTGGEACACCLHTRCLPFLWCVSIRMPQVIFNMLVEHGVDTVFGYSGGAVSSHESRRT